jgi:tetratricopeptide (TPR) repeat protein
MRNIIITSIFLFLGISCASSIQNNSKITSSVAIKDSTKRSNEATNHFVDGSILEMKGKYAEAILEYQIALELDPNAGIYYTIAKNYYRLNKLPQALQNSKKSVELDSTHIEFNELLAKIYVSSKQLADAAKIYERIIRLDSLNTNAYFNLGLLYENDKPIQALGIFNKLLDITGPEWNLLIKIADLNERMGNVDKTIETVENLLALDPSNLELQKLLIESYIKTAKYEKGLKLISETLTLFPDDLQLLEMQANALILNDEWDEGRAAYSRLINREDFSFVSKLRIGGLFFNKALTDSASVAGSIEILNEINKDSSDWQVNAYLGELNLRENKDSIAIDYFNKAAELAAWNAEIWIRLGGLLFDSGRYEIAVEKLGGIIENFPNEFVLNIILGLSYGQLNKHADSKPYLEKALQINPNDFTALYALGFTFNQLNETDEAIIYLNRALEIDSDNVQILGTLGLIYDNKEMYTKSDSVYEKALSIDSTDVLVLNNFAYSLAERGIQLERALEMARIAVEREPENSSYLDTFGWVHFKLGDFEEAKKYIQQAIDKNNDSAVLLDHLGDIHYKLGDKQKAIDLWEEAFKMDSTQTEIKLKIEKGEL